MQLRPYQRQAIDCLRDRLRSGVRRAILVAPTGSGKTVIAKEIISLAAAKARRVLFVAPRRELVEQTSTHLDAAGVDHGVMQAKHWRTRPDLQVQVATSATLKNRDLEPPSLIFIDEAHLNLNASIVVAERFPDAIIVGLTATPCRTDGQGLGKLYEDIIEVATPRELIDDGHLVEYRAFAPPAPDLSGVKTRAGDYAHGELNAAVDKPHLTGDAVKTWIKHGIEEATIVFAVGIDHSEHLAEEFRAKGFNARHVDGLSRDRLEVLESLRDGKLQVATCADLYTYGVDAPRVSCIVVCRPTKSMALHMQMIGRGMRPFPGKGELIILDHAGNLHRHGFPDDPREWTLDGVKRKKSDAAPVRTCTVCYCCYPPSLPKCPECGHVPEVVGREPIAVEKGELTEQSRKGREAWAASMSNEKRIEWLAAKVKIGNDRGYKSGWAWFQFKGAFGLWPSKMTKTIARVRAIRGGMVAQ